MALDEFNEEELFSGDEQDHDEGHSDGSAEDVEQQDRRQSLPGAKQKGVDITGASSASHQSSTLHASLDDELGSSLPPASPPVDVPALSSRRAAQLSSSVHPARAHQQYPRLGTSAPIAIPNMMNRWRSDGKAGGQQEAASTFIPPHQLSKQDDFMFSFTGASPSATLKRERLRTRNAILRSTGFLEPGQGTATAVPIPAQALGGSGDSSLPVARTPVQSTLTAALTTIGEA
uniref:Uncharacterized protein n=1 Tax=Tetradesmus obliquus TaxID=3088 RepID=A0A383W314_TETOB|eukprot:jgi/Sobl393_1/4704/SZX71529.1